MSNALRIISLVPSITELLFDLGLNEEVVGITKFCIHPNIWFKNKVRIGGTKQLNIEKIRILKPTLIIANKEENDQAQIEQLQQEFDVCVTDISNISEALTMILDIGTRVNQVEQSKRMINQLEKIFLTQLKPLNPKSALYFIWQNPFMVAGLGTFINDMMGYAGFKNCISNTRYPVIEENDIIHLQPEVILLSSEPFPFKEKHIQTFESLLPQSKIVLVDGEIFSWYGSRMLKSIDYFRALNESLAK